MGHQGVFHKCVTVFRLYFCKFKPPQWAHNLSCLYVFTSEIIRVTWTDIFKLICEVVYYYVFNVEKIYIYLIGIIDDEKRCGFSDKVVMVFALTCTAVSICKMSTNLWSFKEPLRISFHSESTTSIDGC